LPVAPDQPHLSGCYRSCDARPAAKPRRSFASKRRCRRLAEAIWDPEVERRLLEMAGEFEKRAAAEEARERDTP
jgi:hypothetical protein